MTIDRQTDETQIPTWDDLEQAARHCPVLYRAVTLVRSGAATREQALLAAALFLSKERAEYLARETDRLSRDVPPHYPPKEFLA